MEVNQERKFKFLRNKYIELLLPTFFMVVSEKVAVVIDVIIIGFLAGSALLAVVDLAAPMTYITGMFYILFGQGGNLLALRAQSQLDNEKMNYYFTISIIGIILFSIIYMALIFIFIDDILVLFSTPAEIFGLAKEYLLIMTFYYPLNCYVLVISFFIRSDGFPKMPFYAVLLANVINIILDILFLNVFHLGIPSTALATVLGYLVGAIYISSYLFRKKGSFHLISLAKYKAKDLAFSIKEYVFNTPEVIGKLFFAIKMSVLTYLCSTYWGVAGLLAFLVYDNSESFVYIFLSGIMKTMSPIVTVFHKEEDYEAVRYIIALSLKHTLVIAFPISAIFFVYPEILISMFSISNPHYVEVVTLAIRITAFSLVGRCMSYLLANYTQATEKNRIALVITFLEEFLFILLGALIFTKMIGGVGIWVAILVAECLPAIVYIIYTSTLPHKFKNRINRLFMIQNSNLISWTYNRNDVENVDKYLYEESGELAACIKNIFTNHTSSLSNSINDVCNDIFENCDVDDIDLTIRLAGEKLYIVFTNEGRLYNPFSNEKLIESDNIRELSELDCEFDYEEILGFNKSYIIHEI